MKPILVLYATREGQTRRIAEHVAADIRAGGKAADVVNARDAESSLDLTAYAAVVVAASLHLGKYEHEMVSFVRERRDDLEKLPTAFLSVSMTEAAAENARASEEDRAQARKRVEDTIVDFFEQTKWHPRMVKPIAGAVLYTKYNLLVRFVMKQISKSEGASTDTSRDHEYTDWAALDRFVDELVANIG